MTETGDTNITTQFRTEMLNAILVKAEIQSFPSHTPNYIHTLLVPCFYSWACGCRYLFSSRYKRLKFALAPCLSLLSGSSARPAALRW